MQHTPRANRLHIAIFGRRNAGKSSLINAITDQPIALVSDQPGTTTDPVFKAMELMPLGPVVFIDTAGLDDEGELGELRVRRTREVMDRTDLALLLFTSLADTGREAEWLAQLQAKRIPVIGVWNKSDLGEPDLSGLQAAFPIPFVKVSAANRLNIDRLKTAIAERVPGDFERADILGDLVHPGALVILVMPQNIQAPKGRLILPQVQVIRDLLDHHACALAVTEEELAPMLAALNRKPDLVITDSQVFQYVAGVLPPDVRLTSFSILMARFKGDLAPMVEGALAIGRLRPGDPVLVAEACTHHPLQGDIGREKLPHWLEARAGGRLAVDTVAGANFPDDLSRYKLVVHCGGCMLNRKMMVGRMARTGEAKVPITNYGVAIAYLNGILERAVEPFGLLQR